MGFTAGGENWEPRVTCLTLRRFEEETGINLLHQIPAALGSGQQDEIILGLSFLDNILGGKFNNLLKAIYLSVEPQVKNRSMAEEKFYELLEGKEREIFKEAIKAYADFFQRTIGSLISKSK